MSKLTFEPAIISSVLFGKYQNRTENTETEFSRYRFLEGTDRYLFFQGTEFLWEPKYRTNRYGITECLG
jgi:hypothetical protein